MNKEKIKEVKSVYSKKFNKDTKLTDQFFARVIKKLDKQKVL